MRLRLTVVLPTVLLLALLLPPGTPATAAVPTDTVVDAIEGLPPNDGVRAQAIATVTEPIRAPITFSMLAFTAPPGATVAYRTSTDGGAWGAWTQAEGGDDVDLVDSMGLSRSVLQRVGDAVRAAWHGTKVGQPAQAAGQPTLVTRSRWGADESLRSDLRAGRYRYTFTSGRRTPETGTFAVVAAPYDPPFSDDDGSVHETSITSLYNHGVTLGCTATRFCPRRMVSRGQMASFVARTMDHLIVARPADAPDRFVDDTGSVHASAIDSLAAAGVVTGCGPDVFCPADDALRGDVAVWLASAFGLTPQGDDNFTDDDGSDAEWAINALADAGLTVGCTDDTYCPEDATSRAQMASFLSRAIDQLESSGLAG